MALSAWSVLGLFVFQVMVQGRGGQRVFAVMTLYDRIFTESKTVAVVGLSANPGRPSYGVSRYMQSVGFHIVPVNPNETEILGEKCFARLEDVPFPVHIVDIFRRPEYVAPIVESAIAMGAKVVWMQEGVFHRASAERARQAGLDVVMDRCILKEHMAWIYALQHASPAQPTSELF